MSTYYLLDRIPARIIQNSTLTTEPVPLYRSRGVVTLSETGCWVWNGGCRGDYGVIRYEGRQHGVHRLVYSLAVHPVPDNLEVDHMCRNTRCWNPEHLDPVTTAENALRATYHRQTDSKKPVNTKDMPADLWALCVKMVKFRPADLVFEASRLPGRDRITRQTVGRWLVRDPRVIRLEYGWYTVE